MISVILIIHEINHFLPISVVFSGVETLLVWLRLGEVAVSGEGGRGMEKRSSAMVNWGGGVTEILQARAIEQYNCKLKLSIHMRF